ncbi:MAG: DNA methyltransferase [Candidatus Odinarchaeia archaeon]
MSELKIFFLLSGEHATLPFSECVAILESEGFNYKIVEKLDQVFIVKCSERAAKRVVNRAGMVYMCGNVLYDGSIDDFNVKKLDLSSLTIEGAKTFAVRFKRVKNYRKDVSLLQLAKHVGGFIHEYFKPKLKTDLEQPELLFQGVITSDDRLVFGLVLGKNKKKEFYLRKGKFRPFFYPGIMEPKLARVMVNLTRVKKGDILLDPFIGTGGIGIEAGLIGCKVIGMDLDKKMIYGSRTNLTHYNVINWHLIYGDARRIPLSKVDGITTDPPYGISATTMGEKAENLISEFLSQCEVILPRKKYLCFALPSKLNFANIKFPSRLHIIETHEMYVHRSLTRRILVVRS